MTAWDEFSAADFDASRADRKAAKRAAEDARAGQAGLFFTATPERAAKPKPQAERLPGEVALFGADDREGL